MSETASVPENRILQYLQDLTTSKKGLPFGQPVAVLASDSVTDTAALVKLASELGPHIAVFQVQAEIIDDWSDNTIEQLTYYAKKHGFILWEGSRVLNCTVNFMGRGSADFQTRMVAADFTKRKYTHGTVKIAQWSNLASSWAPGVPLNEQEMDLLIPTLRKAAREAVATTVKTIETEISAANGEVHHEEVETPTSPPSSNGWLEFSSENFGSALRKSSTISVTESVTLQPHVEPDEGVPSPPLLSRGLALCLPSAIDSAFTPEFRQSTVMAACANHDFVVGFYTCEPLFTTYTRDYLFDLAFQDSNGHSPQIGRDTLEAIPYLENKHSFALFSLVPTTLLSGFESDPIHSINGSSADNETPKSVAQLFYVIDQALKSRNAHRKEQSGSPLQDALISVGPRVFHVPLVILP
ncbi:hypothetical protein POX_c03967 [Penicillium oxalicum]|uniref:Orotidine 5'-phosphate decarboxylase domain-containing protein n=1 Tax=Penicillium oxalicum (strain 114-2 / CGMCC 5302) TaxID=933388 RepID=S7Z635_PENO1|nr:hypothetical protein POX_c03967 [Penicillium oxalicum]EPS25589.1 hypothetical protein PDE_00523 [Penicillium oxalicum 114-2]KAI2791112.1 hypothetical protein POX_c03967 [Penicillium oxalicum]